MKKLFLLLFIVTSFLQAQTYQNPTFGTVTTKTSPTVTDDPYLTTTGTTGIQGKIAPVNLLIPYTPTNYSVPNLTIGAHLGGIDTRLGQISSTTAGITQRVYFTADNTTVNSVVYFASSLSGKGSTASGSPPALVLADNTKAYFTKDVISIAQPSPTIGYAGTYSGNLTVSATPTPVATQQRFTVEIYRTDNLGAPIASGVSGAPTGDLGVTVLAILDSGIINLSAGSITNVPVSGILTQNITLNTSERLRYHVSAAKIGTGGGNVTFGVYYGTAYNSYYDVPVAITTDAVLNKSSVTGITSSDALNALNTNKANDSNVIHKSGDTFVESIGFPPLLSQNESNLNIEKRYLSPETTKLPVANTTILCWGDSLTAGAGSSPGFSYPSYLGTLTAFNIIGKGVGGETSTEIKDRMIADTGNYDKTVIIWAGRNNATDPVTIKADIATMISALTHDRYLVLGVINGEYSSEYAGSANYNTIVQLNADLSLLYGKKYVPIRERLVSLHDNTPQGLLDASRDIVPYNLRSDNIHLNDAGYVKVAEFIFQRLGILLGQEGYLQSKDVKGLVEDYNFMHLYKNETFTGLKTSNNTTDAIENGLIFSNSGNGTTVGSVSLSVTGLGNGIYGTANNGGSVLYGSITGSSFGARFANSGVAGLRVDNTSSATNGILINTTGSARGVNVSNTGSGQSFSTTVTANGTGFFTSVQTGSGYLSTIAGTGTGINITTSGAVSGVLARLNSATGSTGDILQIRKNGADVSVWDSNGIRKVINSPTTSTGGYEIYTRNTTTGLEEKVPSTTFAPTASPTFTGTAGFYIADIDSGYIGFSTNTSGVGSNRPAVFRQSDRLGLKGSITNDNPVLINTDALSAIRTVTVPDSDGTLAVTLNGSATLDFPSTAAGSSSELNITVTGASEGDVVALGVTNSAVLSNSCYTARVSAANTVTVRFNNYSSSSADPASGTFKVKVFK